MAGGRWDRGGFIYSGASSRYFHCSSAARKHSHRGLDQRVKEATTPPTHTQPPPKPCLWAGAEAGWLHKPLTSMLSSWSAATAGASPGRGSAPHTGPWGATAPEDPISSPLHALLGTRAVGCGAASWGSLFREVSAGGIFGMKVFKAFPKPRP